MALPLFFRLCTFLIEHCGYPCHWISNIIEAIIAGNGRMYTRARLSTVSPNQFTGYSSKRHAINIQAFYLEFTTQASIWRQNLIKPVLAARLPSLCCIKKFTIQNLRFQTSFHQMSIIIQSSTVSSSDE